MKRKYVPILEEGGFSDNFYNTLNNYMQIMSSRNQNEENNYYEEPQQTETKEDFDYEETFNTMTSRIDDLEQRLEQFNNLKSSLPESNNSSMDLIKFAMDSDFENENLMLGQYSNDENIGFQGKQIVNDISKSLGFTPVFNSIYRTKEKQNSLIKQGLPAVKNSFHLTGDAVDMKPKDWDKIPQEKKTYLKSKYDVIFHNNHYHLEPKGKH